MRMIDLTNQRFGRLLVLRRDDEKQRIGKYRSVVWACACDCGSRVSVTSLCLRSKKSPTRSCGCITADRCTTHGEAAGKRTKLYTCWRRMIARCENSKDPRYADYGGRGIKVFHEWKVFADFRRWARMNGYRPGLTIERDDVDGNYWPGNVRWIPLARQARNKRNTLWVELQGKRVSLAEACERLSVDYRRTWERMKRYGWSFEQAVAAPKIEPTGLRQGLGASQ